MEWLNQNQGLLSLAATFIYLLTTVLIIRQSNRANTTARETVEEMRRARESQDRPYVVFDITYEPETSSVFAEIRNLGKTAAFDLRLNLTEDIQVSPFAREEPQPLSAQPWAKGLEMLVPGRAHRLFIGVAPNFFQVNKGRRLVGAVEYRGVAPDRSYREPLALEIDDLGQMVVGIPVGPREVVSALENIRRALEEAGRRR